MNYKKSLLITAIALGTGVAATAQSAKFSLNGLGRSVLTNNGISGGIVDNVNDQTSATSGYNLFDLQTNLAIDSSFQAMAIFRARSPFGSFFGATTAFEFRQFKMMGELADFKYEIGDIRVEMTPYTVFNIGVTCNRYESDIFKQRRSIQEYENFNQGNSWLLQGVAGQYFWKLNDDGMGLGLYAFGTRNTSTNELTVPDRLLSGGRIEYHLNKDIKAGVNAVSLFDISLLSADFDYNNHVFTADASYNLEMDGSVLSVKAEGGVSLYTYSEFVDQDTIVDQTDTSYQDAFVDVNVGYLLKDAKLKFDLNGRMVGVLFSSPSAQTRRINVGTSPQLFGGLASGARMQALYDRSTAEEIYNSKITPTLMAFIPYYNNSTPYGRATANRVGGSLKASTDTSQHNFDAGVKVSFLQELLGEGTPDKRSFLLASGGVNLHLGKMLDFGRMVDVNVGGRFESTNRSGSAPVALSSLLIDAGVGVEILKKIDLLGGMKFLVANGNEYAAIRDGFNLITDFTPTTVNVNETIMSFGARVRFSTSQYFTVNYNLMSLTDNDDNSQNYKMNQLFVNYTGKF